MAVSISDAVSQSGNGGKGASVAPPEEQATAAPKFPSGTAALYKSTTKDGKKIPYEDEETVTLVNVSLSVVRFPVRNIAIKGKKGFEEIRTEIKPFGWQDIEVRHARRVLRSQEKRGGDSKLVVAPVDGDCKGMSFTGFGQVFRTCPFANCKTCGPLPERMKWSVWQVQHRISKLATDVAITRIIKTIDPRSPVVMWGLEVITQRERLKRQRLGYVGSVNPAEVVY